MPSLCNNIAVNNPCKSFPDANCVVYTGSDLTNTGIKTNDRLSLIIHKLDATIGVSALSFTYPLNRTGKVVAWVGTTTDVPEGTNLYYTNTRVKSYADTLYVSLSGSYTDPSWLVSIPYSKITGVPTHTSSFTNDGADGTHPFISLEDIPPQTFQHDIVVSLPSGEKLGAFPDGTTIPSTGKTAEQVIKLLAQAPKNPLVTLTSSTVVEFNQTAISNVLNFSYTIESLGATVATAVLEWRRNNSGSWTTLDTSTTDTTYTHTLIDSAFNTQSFNYRYTVTDSQGATATHTFDITPQAYVAPSITFSAPATALALSIESNQTREIGNTSSVLQGSTSRNSHLVPILSYQFSISINGGSFSNVGSSVSLSSSGGSFTNYTDSTATSSATTITYKVTVTDGYTTTSATYSINLYYVIFFGPVSSASTNSAQVRANSNYQFVNGSNPFILNTGTTDKIFEIAFDAPHGISQILDLDALSANITGSFIETDFNVNDGGGTPTAYRIFDMTNAITYASNHRFQSTYI